MFCGWASAVIPLGIAQTVTICQFIMSSPSWQVVSYNSCVRNGSMLATCHGPVQLRLIMPHLHSSITVAGVTATAA